MSAPVLVVAGSDPLGYSGLQADLRHLAALRQRAFAVPTCLTEQEAGRVRRILPVDPSHVSAVVSLAAAEGIGAVKVGLLNSAAVVHALDEALRGLTAPVVLDPVIDAGSGDPLLEKTALPHLLALLPRITLLTPNLPELFTLARAAGGKKTEDVLEAAMRLRDAGATWVLVKGGHDTRDAPYVADRLIGPGFDLVVEGPRHPGRPPRGTGCALATAIAAFLADGLPVADACRAARDLVSAAILRAQEAGTRWLELEPLFDEDDESGAG